MDTGTDTRRICDDPMYRRLTEILAELLIEQTRARDERYAHGAAKPRGRDDVWHDKAEDLQVEANELRLDKGAFGRVARRLWPDEPRIADLLLDDAQPRSRTARQS